MTSRFGVWHDFGELSLNRLHSCINGLLSLKSSITLLFYTLRDFIKIQTLLIYFKSKILLRLISSFFYFNFCRINLHF